LLSNLLSNSSYYCMMTILTMVSIKPTIFCFKPLFKLYAQKFPFDCREMRKVRQILIMHSEANEASARASTEKFPGWANGKKTEK